MYGHIKNLCNASRRSYVLRVVSVSFLCTTLLRRLIVAYFSGDTVLQAAKQLHGTAGHMLKLWFVLKRMGLDAGSAPILIDTSNSTSALTDLFACGSPEGNFFVPFGHSPRFKEMKHDAARSIIQTNVRRWASSDSVVGCDPTSFLGIEETSNNQLRVKCSNNYPLGLGFGGDGFAIGENKTVEIPWLAWVVWYCRQRDLGPEFDAVSTAESIVLSELNISSAEKQLIFVSQPLECETQPTAISDESLWEICKSVLDVDQHSGTIEVRPSDFASYSRKVRAMVPNLGQPVWLRPDSEKDFRDAIDRGEVAILLYGPPRTGKTRTIDSYIARSDSSRATIQLHDGWSYDQLVQGILPTGNGGWEWTSGPLLNALRAGKKFIVLEEANRTSLVQALGEIFSLLERQYRGKGNSITLRSGEEIWVEDDVVFVLTANNLDKSTEDLDDALLGRLCAIECPPDSRALTEMLIERGLDDDRVQSIVDVFVAIQEIYPLGHGYFASVNSNSSGKDIREIYKTRIRPVIFNFLGPAAAVSLNSIDVTVGVKTDW